MDYRAEIDGLRALAVLPVILFHAGFEWFSGGFVGVDVFFVISGYLITTIIISEMAEEKFSILNFYERRARRILPALFFVMAACLPFAWLWLAPYDLRDFGQSLVAVSTFSSNILFWWEKGYFDTAAELKPLLHTWSLAVEEQYYILFPIFLLLTWRLGIKWVLVLLVIVFVISLSIAQWGAYIYPSSTFFLLPARGWELLVGAFVAFWLKHNRHLDSILVNQILSLLGLGMIISSIVLFDESIPFPSFYALLPTIGTCLLIFCAVPKTIVHKLLSLKLLVGAGLISYSAYLWHQPILAFARHRWAVDLEDHILIGLCIASLFLAWFSWRFVERPFRIKGKIKRHTIFIFSFAGILIFSLIGFRFHITGGELNRFDDTLFSPKKIDIYGYHHSKLLADECHNSSGTTILACVIGGEQRPKVALVGDSHAHTLKDSLNEILLNKEKTFIQYTKNGCPPSSGMIDSEVGDACMDFMKKVQNDIESKSIDVVVLFARWAYYIGPRVYENNMGWKEAKKGTYSTSGIPFTESETIRRREIIKAYIKFVEALKEKGKRVIVVGAVPVHGWSVPTEIAKNYLTSGEVTIRALPKSVYAHRVSFLEPFYNYLRISQIEFIDPTTLFCNESPYCKALDEDGDALYWDGGHLSKKGAMLIVRKLIKETSLIK